jgi:hypothetical protein
MGFLAKDEDSGAGRVGIAPSLIATPRHCQNSTSTNPISFMFRDSLLSRTLGNRAGRSAESTAYRHRLDWAHAHKRWRLSKLDANESRACGHDCDEVRLPGYLEPTTGLRETVRVSNSDVVLLEGGNGIPRSIKDRPGENFSRGCVAKLVSGGNRRVTKVNPSFSRSLPTSPSAKTQPLTQRSTLRSQNSR